MGRLYLPTRRKDLQGFLNIATVCLHPIYVHAHMLRFFCVKMHIVCTSKMLLEWALKFFSSVCVHTCTCTCIKHKRMCLQVRLNCSTEELSLVLYCSILGQCARMVCWYARIAAKKKIKIKILSEEKHQVENFLRVLV